MSDITTKILYVIRAGGIILNTAKGRESDTH